jgi:hypothetical protein
MLHIRYVRMFVFRLEMRGLGVLRYFSLHFDADEEYARCIWLYSHYAGVQILYITRVLDLLPFLEASIQSVTLCLSQ